MTLGDRHTCRLSLSTLAGLALAGCGVSAYAQDPSAVAVALTGGDSWAALLELFKLGGLPLALMYFAWQARGWLSELTITVSLDEKSIDRIADRVKEEKARPASVTS